MDGWRVVLYFNVWDYDDGVSQIIHVVCRSDKVWQGLEANTWGIPDS